jgi:hypothetical protein
MRLRRLFLKHFHTRSSTQMTVQIDLGSAARPTLIQSGENVESN